MVAPFLPRTGIAYIPRPALIGTPSGIASAADLVVSGITPGLADRKVTLRAWREDTGQKIMDSRISVGLSDTSIEFAGLTAPAGVPVVLRMLTSAGQVGSMHHTWPAAAVLGGDSRRITAMPSLTGRIT